MVEQPIDFRIVQTAHLPHLERTEVIAVERAGLDRVQERPGQRRLVSVLSAALRSVALNLAKRWSRASAVAGSVERESRE